MASPSKLDALLRGIASQSPSPQYVRAYHGSPQAADVLARGLDPSRIGSGKGTAEGHGYFFSDARDLARQYGDPIEVEIAVPRERLVELHSPLRRQPEMLDRFAEAILAAPENKWKQDAFVEMMRRDGSAQLAYQSLLRAHNVGAGGDMLGRAEAGRRASKALFDQGVLGGTWLDDSVQAGARNYIMFPGTEDSIRLLRVQRP